jgi:hypothetical protein
MPVGRLPEHLREAVLQNMVRAYHYIVAPVCPTQTCSKSSANPLSFLERNPHYLLLGCRVASMLQLKAQVSGVRRTPDLISLRIGRNCFFYETARNRPACLCTPKISFASEQRSILPSICASRLQVSSRTRRPSSWPRRPGSARSKFQTTRSTPSRTRPLCTAMCGPAWARRKRRPPD